jgi:hypothetical protein
MKIRNGLAFLAVAACGGGMSGPSPIQYTLDDFHIAPVPVESKGTVITAKQELDVSQMERAKTQSDMEKVNTQLQIAKNDISSAQLAIQNAETRRQAAQRTANVNDQNEAEKQMHVADLQKKVADSKVAFLEAKQGMMVKQMMWHDWDVAAKEANWQLEKARIAQRNGIRPQGFALGNFERQYQERVEGSGRARAALDGATRDVEDKQRAWSAAQTKYDQAVGGGQSPAPAPAQP